MTLDNTILVYSPGPQPIIGWTYPIQHFSPRFQQVNALARILDSHWYTLDPIVQAQWFTIYDPLTAKFICVLLDEDGGQQIPDNPGRAAYIACNLNRFHDKMNFTDTPPVDPFA